MASFVPATGRARIAALYDPVVGLTMRERRFRGAVLDAALAGSQPARILDLGCGTGTLAVGLARQASVVGIDADPAMIERTRRRARDTKVELELHEARADELPFADHSFDRVVSSLLLHHLAAAPRRRALSECRRVLKPAGRLVVADWGAPRDVVMRVAFLGLRLLDGFANTADHAAGRLPGLIADAGFADVRTTTRLRTAWGSLEIIEAT